MTDFSTKRHRQESRPTTRRDFLKKTGLGITSLASGAGLSEGLFLPNQGSAQNPLESPTDVQKSGRYEVGAYYFPNYHVDPRNEARHGKDWTEWKLVETATPRFPNHRQPRVPLWGPCDESKPEVMEMKIDTAADSGLTYWIFDWYYYNDGPFLNRCLEEGFLRAKNNDRIKFCAMWANHDWIDIHPWTRGTPQPLLYPGVVTGETFEKITDSLLGYFRHPSHFQIDGSPYFSIYDLTNFLASFGGIAPARTAVDRFREKVKAAGFPDLHLNAVVWGQPVLPVEKTPADPLAILDGIGFDSVTSYVWIHHVPLNQLETPYETVRNAYFAYWDRARTTYRRPYYPNVSVGWDSSPRTNQKDEYGNWGYPFTNTISGNTPQAFWEALKKTREKMEADPNNPRILNINSWNEWTEGSYLEPDTVTKKEYLDAIKAVFKT